LEVKVNIFKKVLFLKNVSSHMEILEMFRLLETGTDCQVLFYSKWLWLRIRNF